jgi:hypothetical protein
MAVHAGDADVVHRRGPDADGDHGRARGTLPRASGRAHVCHSGCLALTSYLPGFFSVFVLSRFPGELELVSDTASKHDAMWAASGVLTLAT